MRVNKKFLAGFSLFLVGFISPLSSMNTRIICQQITARDLCHKVLDCFTFVDGSFSLEEAVDDLYKARGLLVDQGYNVPLLSVIFEKTFENIENQGIFLDRDFVEDLYELVLLKESEEIMEASFYSTSQFQPKIIQVKKKKKKELQVPDGVAIGFCKALAGGLLCIIPSGITQTLGTGLILSGVNDMIQHANDPINDGSGGSWEDDLNRRQGMGAENTSWIPLNREKSFHGIISA